jgi:cysteine desulfurase
VPDADTGAGAEASDRSGRVAGLCPVCVPGVETEALLFLLERSEVYASAASSCSSGAAEPSHVLAAMGVPRDLAFGSLRLSLGYSSTDADVDAALAVIPPAVARLRSFAGARGGD